MTATSTPTIDDVLVKLQPFIAGVLGVSTSIVMRGPINRAAMPAPSPGFVLMRPGAKRRLRTNQNTWDETNSNPTSMQHEQGIEFHVQLDCYGPASAQWADILTTLLRDETGCAALAPACAPLYCGDAQFAPLVDSEEQYEERWTFDAIVQYNPVVSDSAQFAAAAAATLINVDEAYPP